MSCWLACAFGQTDITQALCTDSGKESRPRRSIIGIVHWRPIHAQQTVLALVFTHFSGVLELLHPHYIFIVSMHGTNGMAAALAWRAHQCLRNTTKEKSTTKYLPPHHTAAAEALKICSHLSDCCGEELGVLVHTRSNQLLKTEYTERKDIRGGRNRGKWGVLAVFHALALRSMTPQGASGTSPYLHCHCH